MPNPSLLGPIAVLSLCLLCSAQNGRDLTVGDTVPPLTGVDTSGKPLSWKHEAFVERATLVYFHSSSIGFSTRGLSELASMLAKAKTLQPRLAALVVTNSALAEKELQREFATLGVPAVVTVDAARDRFRSYHVIAYPSVFVLDPARKIQHIVRGYGPFFVAKVIAACKHAAGLIDRAEHDEMIGRGADVAPDQARTRVDRNLAMAKKLISVGDLETARDVLTKVVKPDSKHKASILMLADVLLRLEDAKQAKAWIVQLRNLGDKSADLAYLEAELAVLLGKPDEALRILDESTVRSSRSDWIRGRAFQLKGNFEAAALAYQSALRELMRKRL